MKITTYTGKKLKVETRVKERDQQLLDFITIDVIKIEQKQYPDQDIITLTMNLIINSSFNKHPMSWEIINFRLIHPSESATKAMCHNQTLNGLPNHWYKKLNQAPCKICYTKNMTTFPKGKNVDKTNLKPGEFIHMNPAF